MTGRIQDKVIIVTGGASGIGEAMVRRFCAEGAKVFLADVQQELGHSVAASCGAQYLQLDVSSPADWQTAMTTVISKYGRLDGLLNNAGIVSNLSIMDATVESWNRLMAVNLTGVMLGCQAAIAAMKLNPEGSGGAIVNTSSSTSFLAIPSDVAYVASKAGVVGLTKSVAVYCATEGLNIRCNSIHPGATPTAILQPILDANPELVSNLERMSPLGRMGKAEEVAAMALFLVSDEASYCTGGQFPVEGGTVSEHPRMF